MPAPVYISQKRMTNGKLNSPQNISPMVNDITNQEQKSIPSYMYDIFETKLSMQNWKLTRFHKKSFGFCRKKTEALF